MIPDVFVYRNHISSRCFGPSIYRNKSKYWEDGGSGAGAWHRTSGPARIKHDQRDWFINDVCVTLSVLVWCLSYDLDIDDLTEGEILIMWSEIL